VGVIQITKNFLGKRVKHDVMNSVGLVIIQSKTILEPAHIELLEQHRVDTFSIVFESPDGSEDSSVNLLVVQVVDQSMKIFHSIHQTRKIPVMEFKNTIIPTVQLISNDPNIFRIFEAVKAKDDYTHQHNIGVGVLATLIGKWLNMGDSELASLSLAATLHDVGKVKIPLEILHKPGKLTNEEFSQIKQHTVFGYEMLKDTVGISQRMALVALQHHEKEDGTGYPLGLKKDQIDIFSKIVAVADIFHAMSSKRPYHDPIPFYEIITQMRQEIFGKLEPYIVSVFIKNITKKLVGKKVILTDGREGEIVFINPNDDMNHLIKVNNDFIDLNLDPSIQIQEIIS
jgi:HD-GYP domain-containing protein (c-di-GMP phosphodiesterase class II)